MNIDGTLGLVNNNWKKLNELSAINRIPKISILGLNASCWVSNIKISIRV